MVRIDGYKLLREYLTKFKILSTHVCENHEIIFLSINKRQNLLMWSLCNTETVRQKIRIFLPDHLTLIRIG
jgi:hypothetical protein